MKTLIVYYSLSGNTQRVANMIHDFIPDACIERIETVEPYTGSSDKISKQGEEEIANDFKPKIKPLKYDFKDFDRIIIGTPTWWYCMAPAVSSYFEGKDFSGKDVALFMTNAGWYGMVIEQMKKACKGANILGTKKVFFDSEELSKMITKESEIEEWVKSFTE